MPERIDLLRTHAERLDNAANEDGIEEAYLSLTGLAAETKAEKEVVAEALERNREKIVDAKLATLDALSAKIEQVSTLDLGDHVGDIMNTGSDAVQSHIALGASVLDAGKDATIAVGTNAVKGAGISLNYARSLIEKGKEKHPVAFGALSAIGGAAAIWGLMKLYKWVNSSPEDQEKPSIWRRSARVLGLGAVATGALAMVGINAKEAVAAAPSPAPNAPVQVPAIDQLNQAGIPVELADIPEDMQMLHLTVPVIIDGKQVQFAKIGFMSKPVLYIDGAQYEIQGLMHRVAIGIISSIERKNGGLIIGDSFVTDAALVRLVNEVHGNASSTVDVAYKDGNQNTQNTHLEFRKI